MMDDIESDYYKKCEFPQYMQTMVWPFGILEIYVFLIILKTQLLRHFV